MTNPFWELFRLSGESQEAVAEAIQLSRPTLSIAIWKDRIPDQVKLGTMNRIAAHFGKRVVIRLEPIEEPIEAA